MLIVLRKITNTIIIKIIIKQTIEDITISNPRIKTDLTIIPILTIIMDITIIETIIHRNLITTSIITRGQIITDPKKRNNVNTVTITITPVMNANGN